jgi:hypothetical protein
MATSIPSTEKGPVSYVAVNSMNTRIVTVAIATKVRRVTRFVTIIKIWDAVNGNLVARIKRDIAPHNYPVPRFSPCGTLMGIPLCDPSGPRNSTVEFINPQSGELGTRVDIPGTIFAIALSQNRLAISRTLQVTTSSPEITSVTRGCRTVDHVYGRNLSYVDGERYVLAIVRRCITPTDDAPESLEHAIVKWDVVSGSILMYFVPRDYGHGPDLMYNDMELVTVLNKGAVAVLCSVRYPNDSKTLVSSRPAPDIEVFSVEPPTEVDDISRAGDQPPIAVLPRENWDFVPFGMTKEGLNFVSNGYLCRWNFEQQETQKLAHIGSHGGSDVIALAISGTHLTLVHKDGDLEVFTTDEATMEIGARRLSKSSIASSLRRLSILLSFRRSN